MFPAAEGTVAHVASITLITAMKLENVLMLGHFDVVLARKQHSAILHDGKILGTGLVDDLEPIAILSNSIDRGNAATMGWAKMPWSAIFHRGGVSICYSCWIHTLPLRAILAPLHGKSRRSADLAGGLRRSIRSRIRSRAFHRGADESVRVGALKHTLHVTGVAEAGHVATTCNAVRDDVGHLVFQAPVRIVDNLEEDLAELLPVVVLEDDLDEPTAQPRLVLMQVHLKLLAASRQDHRSALLGGIFGRPRRVLQHSVDGVLGGGLTCNPQAGRVAQKEDAAACFLILLEHLLTAMQPRGLDELIIAQVECVQQLGKGPCSASLARAARATKDELYWRPDPLL